jgi:hypothetical protein
MPTITKSSNQLVALVAGVAVAASLLVSAFAIAPSAQAAALTQSQISSIVSLLQSFGADAQTIANVQASLNGQPTSGGSTGGSTGGTASCSVSWTRDLQQGSTGSDVMALQKTLNMWPDTMVAASGAGSPGNETTTFGPATKAAVIKFQTKYNVTPIAGYFGAKSRAQLASICSGSTGGTTPTGPGLSVSAGAQPANALAPAGASRVPFTTFTITNNSGVVQTVNGVTVERTGPSVNSNLAGVVLVDSSNGVQLGIAKTLNSSNQATIGDTFTINPGQTLTLTVAGNIAGDTIAQSGQIVSLRVVAVNSSAPISGSLPITGASHTINTSLSLGSFSTSTSSFDPGIAQNKSIGDTDVRFTGIRFGANAQEDLRLYSIRWRQTGSAGSSDLGSVVTVVNGTSYPTIVDSSGKYYTTSFPGGLLIPKGQSVDAYIKGNIVGSNVTGRTAEFDIDRSTDVYFVGQTYGYGVTDKGCNNAACTNQPWLAGYVVNIQPGQPSTISRATEVGAQNIAVNVSNQPLGAFATDFIGEAVSAQTMTFTIATTGVTGLLTDLTVVNQNGSVVAGPEDATWNNGVMQVVFSDTVTFPVGRQVYTVRGKIPSGASTGAGVQVTVTPSNWTNVTGQTSGSTVDLSSFGGFTLSQMTVQGASLVISLSSQPSSQSITANQSNFTFASPVIDASGSGEDLRISNIKLRLDNKTGLSGCAIWDGSNNLSGANLLNNASLSTSGDNNFTFTNPLVITKGTVKTLNLKCNLSAGTGTYTWTLAGAGSVSATGVTSGNTFSVTPASIAAGTMSVGDPTVAVTVAPSSPTYKLSSAGQTGVVLAAINLRAENENLTLNKLGVKLSSGTRASLANVYVYDNGTQVGTIQFTDDSGFATSSNLNITAPAGSDKVITVVADLVGITSGNASTTEGALVKVDPSGAEFNSESQGLIKQGASGSVAGIRIFKSVPTTVAQDSMTTTGALDGKLLRFKVTADQKGPVSLGQMTFKVSTSSNLTVANVGLYVTDAGGQPVSQSGATNSSGLVNALQNIGSAGALTVTPATNPIQIPAGQTYTFELRASTVTANDNNPYSITTRLVADTSGKGIFPRAALSGDNFQWSGNATTTATLSGGNDWTNGAGISGFSSDLIQTRSN